MVSEYLLVCCWLVSSIIRHIVYLFFWWMEWSLLFSYFTFPSYIVDFLIFKHDSVFCTLLFFLGIWSFNSLYILLFMHYNLIGWIGYTWCIIQNINIYPFHPSKKKTKKKKKMKKKRALKQLKSGLELFVSLCCTVNDIRCLRAESCIPNSIRTHNKMYHRLCICYLKTRIMWLQMQTKSAT